MKKSSFIKKLSSLKKNNIVFIGHMGSGKTAVARKIAEELEIQHLDSDEEIIKYEKDTIKNIFKLKGEDYFREIEVKIISKLLEKKNIVISLGGGSIISKKIRKILVKKSLTIFLDVDLKILVSRLKNFKKRPLLNKVNILEKLKELDIERRKYYLNADIKIQDAFNINKAFVEFVNSFSNIDV